MKIAVKISQGELNFYVGHFLNESYARAWKEAFDFYTQTARLLLGFSTSICKVAHGTLFDIRPYCINGHIIAVVQKLAEDANKEAAREVEPQMVTEDF